MDDFKNLIPVYGIAFDLEGTIIDLESFHHTSHLRAAADVGIDLTWDRAFKLLPHFVGGPDEEVAKEMASLSGLKITAREILYRKRVHFNKILQQSDEIVPREGFIDFLIWLKSRNIKMVIGSVTEIDMIKYLIERSNLKGIFSYNQIVSREDVFHPKPNPEVYLKTAKRLGILPENQLVIEDSLIGMKSALAAGSRVIAIPTVHIKSFKDDLIEEGAEAVFDSWKDPELITLVSKWFYK